MVVYFLSELAKAEVNDPFKVCLYSSYNLNEPIGNFGLHLNTFYAL